MKQRLEDGEPPEEIRRLWDKPQDEWDLQAWRALALYACAELESWKKSEHELLRTADQALSLARKCMPATRLLGQLDRWLASGVVRLDVVKPKKPAGRRPRDSPQRRLERSIAMVELASRMGDTKAADMLAREDLRARRRYAGASALKSRLKTYQNQIVRAKNFVEAHIRAVAGPSPAGAEQLRRLKLLRSQRPRKIPKNRK